MKYVGETQNSWISLEICKANLEVEIFRPETLRTRLKFVEELLKFVQK